MNADGSRTREFCYNCRYFFDGICRRYPPTVVEWDDEGNAMFPEVSGDTWCGEWKPERAA